MEDIFKTILLVGNKECGKKCLLNVYVKNRALYNLHEAPESFQVIPIATTIDGVNIFLEVHYISGKLLT